MDSKVCNKCNLTGKFDGRSGKCRDCVNKQRREKRKENPEYYRKQEKEIRDNNPERTKANDKRNYENNKEKKLAGMKIWRDNNFEYMINYRKDHKKELQEKRKIYDTNNRDKINKTQREYHKRKMNEDELYVLMRKARSRFYNYLKSKNLYKTENTINYVGIDKDVFMEWIGWNIELDNLDFENYHLDHFTPISKFVIKHEEDIYNSRCHHWTNLRPMIPEENLEKSDTLPSKKEIFKMELRINIFKLQNNL